MTFNFDFTASQLKQMVRTNPNVEGWFKSISSFLPTYAIVSPNRVAAWVAQCGHESNDFRFLTENLNYPAGALRTLFSKYFITDQMAAAHERKPEKIANVIYANRMGNGPENTGDGWKYRGRGLIQLTGKSNYSRFAKDIKMSLDDVPRYLETVDGAVHSACWFWSANNINKWADSKDITTMTRIINGGTHGLEDRLLRYNNALQILGEKNV